VTFVVTGPLTNLAVLIRVFPEIQKYIEKVLVMGGSMKEGNITPYAEYNIHSDPEAANVIFQSDLNIVIVTLDATHQVLLDQDHFTHL